MMFTFLEISDKAITLGIRSFANLSATAYKIHLFNGIKTIPAKRE